MKQKTSLLFMVIMAMPLAASNQYQNNWTPGGILAQAITESANMMKVATPNWLDGADGQGGLLAACADPKNQIIAGLGFVCFQLWQRQNKQFDTIKVINKKIDASRRKINNLEILGNTLDQRTQTIFVQRTSNTGIITQSTAKK